MALNPAVPVMIALGATAAIAVPVFIAERRRRQRLLAALIAEGIDLTHHAKAKSPAAAADAFHRLGLLRDLRRGVKGVNIAGRTAVNDREITVVEHSYVVSTGKSAHAVYHSAAAVECPSAWPDLRLKPENFLHKLADFVGLKDIRVESAAFNGAWRVSGRDQEFALTLLTPEIQEKLTAWPKGYWVAIGAGAIVVVTNARLTPDRLNTLVRLITELVDLIPAEMEMWGAEPGAAGSS